MFTEEQKIRTIELYFKYGKKLAPSYANWATLRKEICGVGSVHGKQVADQKNPFVISTVTPMSKNRLPLNIILTTAAAWRLPAGLWVIPVPICSLAGLMNVPPTDDVYLPVRPIRLRPLNQKSNVRLSWYSVHDKDQPVKSPGVLVSVARYCINGKMKLSATVLTRLCVNITPERDALREEVARLNQEIRRRQMELDILKKAEEIIKKDPGISISHLNNREKTKITDALR